MALNAETLKILGLWKAEQDAKANQAMSPMAPNAQQKNEMDQMAAQAQPAPQPQVSSQDMPVNIPNANLANTAPAPSALDQPQLGQKEMDAYADSLKRYAENSQKEQEQLRQYMKNYQTLNQGTNYTPAAAVVGGLWGGNPALVKAAEATAPESPQKQLENTIAQQEALSKLVGESGAQKAMGQLMQGQQRLGVMQQRNDLQSKRLEYQGDKEARAKIDGDKVLNQYQPVVEGANRASEMIQAAQSGKIKATGQFLNQLNGEITKLERGNNGAIAQEGYDKSAYGSQIADIKSLISRYTGKPEDSIPPDLMKVIADNVTELAGSYQKGISDRFDTLQSGLSERQQGIVDEKRKTVMTNLAKRGAFSGGDTVKVSNGVETHIIPRVRLPEAQADNFNEVP